MPPEGQARAAEQFDRPTVGIPDLEAPLGYAEAAADSVGEVPRS